MILASCKVLWKILFVARSLIEQLSLNGLLCKIDTYSWFLPFSTPFICLFIRRTSLYEGHLVSVQIVSFLEKIDCISDFHLQMSDFLSMIPTLFSTDKRHPKLTLSSPALSTTNPGRGANNAFTLYTIQLAICASFSHPFSLDIWFKSLFTWRWGTPGRWGNMWRVTPPNM